MKQSQLGLLRSSRETSPLFGHIYTNSAWDSFVKGRLKIDP